MFVLWVQICKTSGAVRVSGATMEKEGGTCSCSHPSNCVPGGALPSLVWSVYWSAVPTGVPERCQQIKTYTPEAPRGDLNSAHWRC